VRVPAAGDNPRHTGPGKRYCADMSCVSGSS
jgi:hypothetical protein